VALLVVKHGQQLDQAWRFTLREFFAVCDYNSERNGRRRGAWDHDRLSGLEAHLQNMGIA
jgi:hypothetical protein